MGLGGRQRERRWSAPSDEVLAAFHLLPKRPYEGLETRYMGDPLPLWFEEVARGFRFRFADAMLASSARKLFIAYIRSQVSRDTDLFNIELAFGEILGNVARHAPGSVEIELLWQDAGARLEVSDQGPGYELDVELPDVLEESHRGLFLVSQCATDLRVEQRAGRTVTSVMLPIWRADPGTQ